LMHYERSWSAQFVRSGSVWRNLNVPINITREEASYGK